MHRINHIQTSRCYGTPEGGGQEDNAFHAFDHVCSLDHQLHPVQPDLLHTEVPSCVGRRPLGFAKVVLLAKEETKRVR